MVPSVVAASAGTLESEELVRLEALLATGSRFVVKPPRVPDGTPQLAFPLAVIPVANWLAEHWFGVEARAVAVAALPLVLLVIEAGRSAAAKARKLGAPAVPLGAAKT
jgi:hypothetical protein